MSGRGFPQFPQNASPSSSREPQLQAIIWFTCPLPSGSLNGGGAISVIELRRGGSLHMRAEQPLIIRAQSRDGIHVNETPPALIPPISLSLHRYGAIGTLI